MNSWRSNSATLLVSAMLVQTFVFGQQVGMVAYAGNTEIVARADQQTNVRLRFVVADGFYIQANKPSNEAFIPTTLRVTASSCISVGEIKYPKPITIRYGEDSEELSVYKGEVSIILPIIITDSPATKDLFIKGSLYYQACSTVKCYYPRMVDFSVTVKLEDAYVNSD